MLIVDVVNRYCQCCTWDVSRQNFNVPDVSRTCPVQCPVQEIVQNYE